MLYNAVLVSAVEQSQSAFRLDCLVTKSRPPLFDPVDCIAQLFCSWDSPGKNPGVDCHFLLQRIFLALELNPHLPYWQVGFLQLSHQGSLVYQPYVNIYPLFF